MRLLAFQSKAPLVLVPIFSVEIGSPGSGEILSVSELGSFQFGRCALIRSSIVIDQTYRTWVTVLSNFGGTLIFFASEDGPNELGVTLDHWGRWPFRYLFQLAHTVGMFDLETINVFQHIQARARLGDQDRCAEDHRRLRLSGGRLFGGRVDYRYYKLVHFF